MGTIVYHNNSKKGAVILLCIFLFVGIGLIAGAIFAAVTLTNKYEKCSETTEAIVTEISVEEKEDRDSDGDTHHHTYYYPIFDYRVNDTLYTKKSNIGNGDSSKYTVGQKIEIAYVPDDPDTYYIVGDKGFFVVYILGGMGIAFVFIPVLTLITMRKNK